MNSWYQSQNYKVGKATRNTFDDLSQAYSKDFIGQNFNDAYDYALNRRGSVSVKGMSKKITPERLIWNFAARSADRHFKDLEDPKDWLVKIVDNKGNSIDYSNLPVDNKGRRIIDTNKYQFLYEGQTFNKNNLNTKGYQSGLFNDVYKAVNTITSYLNTDVPDPDNPKKIISLGELFEKTDGRIFASIGHDDAKGGVKKKPFNTFKILTNLENQSLFNAYDKIKSPVVRKQVVDFIYGDTKGLRGDKYKEAWINKNVPLITEYIKTGQGLEQTPFKKGLNIFRKPTGTDGPRLGALDVPSMFKRLSPATRKLVGGFGGVVVPEVLFYQLDKRNRMSKGQSEKEAAAGALESGTLGLYNNKVYMDELKKTAKSMGIDSNSFDSAYQLNLLVDRYNQSSATYEKNYEQLLEMGDEKRAEDLKKNFDKYTKNIQDRYSLLANNISDNVMNTVGASPLIMKEGRENITQKQFDKPFFDMQDVALEKLKREAQSVYPIRARKVNPAEGSEGTRFYNMLDFIGQGFKNIALGRANPNLMDLSERQKQERLLKDMTGQELYRYNKDFRDFTYENPITKADLENLLYEQPGLFAGGGIAKIAGVDQGPPPESGPNSQGLSGLFKRVKNI
jgi:hypothetical protein